MVYKTTMEPNNHHLIPITNGSLGSTYCIADVVAHEGLPCNPWNPFAIVFCLKVWYQVRFLRLFKRDGFELEFGLGRVKTFDQLGACSYFRSGQG